MNALSYNSWIRCFNPRPQARLRLLCIPYAGGGAAVFRMWGRALPQTIEVCSIQPPGRENRLTETPFMRIEPLVAELVHILRPMLDMPFALFGHSMGALIAFELARQLRREDLPAPVHLLVSGHRAPQLPPLHTPTFALPEPAFIGELRRLSGTPEAVLNEPELMALIIPLLRADFAVCETYTYADDEPLAIPISAFAGTDDAEVSPEHILPWQIQTRERFNFKLFPGDHFYLNSDPQALLQTIEQELRPYYFS